MYGFQNLQLYIDRANEYRDSVNAVQYPGSVLEIEESHARDIYFWINEELNFNGANMSNGEICILYNAMKELAELGFTYNQTAKIS